MTDGHQRQQRPLPAAVGIRERPVLPCFASTWYSVSGSGGWGRHPPLPRTCAFLSVRRLAPT